MPLVERLAGACGASVMLLHIIERGAPQAVHGDRHVSTAGEADDYLTGVAERLEAAGISVERHAHDAPEGDVARSIVQHQEENAADLIAMCTHGEGNLHTLLFGRIAQQVLRRGTIPVLLVRPESGAPAFGVGEIAGFQPHTILVPLDGSPPAEDALSVAADVARLLGAELHLLMVVPTFGTIRGDRQSVATLLPAATRLALEMEREGAETYLEELAGPLRAQGLSVSTEIRRGEIVSEVGAEAMEPEVGLVVVPTHAHPGIKTVWTGSVAGELLERTHIPLLLIRRFDA